jgi:predicted HTH domain antitoxin
MVDTIDLSYEEEQRRTVLIHKLTQGTISLTEAQELRTILERERHMLTQQGNCLAFFAVRFLMDYVEEYFQSKSNSLLASGS